MLLVFLLVLPLIGCSDKTAQTPIDSSNAQPDMGSADTQTATLTAQELAQWTDYVNSRENNGFLLSSYVRPQQIDMGELFYSGCGLEQDELSAQEAAQYLKLTGMDEICTEMTRITGEQIARILKQRLGLTMADMEKPLKWCYLAESDAYVLQHGDTNAQKFTCVSGVKTGNRVTLDCLSEMTGKICHVTLQLPEGTDVWMFVSNECRTMGTQTTFEDSTTISDAAYIDVVSHVGEEYALQLRTFAENYRKWVPEDEEISPGIMSFAIYDLDGDGRLELLCTQVQGTGLYAFNSFYRADVKNGLVYELEQQTTPEDLAFEIDAQAEVYADQQGNLFYLAADSSKAGLQFFSRSEGYYCLTNETVMSSEIRSYTLEIGENGEQIYTYYLPNRQMPVTENEWEAARQMFLNEKSITDISLCWRGLYKEEILVKNVQGWFLLLAESLEGAQ